MRSSVRAPLRWLIPALMAGLLACGWLLRSDFVPAGPLDPAPGFGAGSDWDVQWAAMETSRAARSRGALPHWDPFPDYGSPVLAHPESFVAHPAWLLGSRWGPAAGLHVLLAWTLCTLFVGFSCLAVELELPWFLGPVAAAALVASFEWEGRLYAGHLMFLGVASWPLALAATSRALRPGASALWGAGAGAVLGLASLGGAHYPTLFGIVLVVLVVWTRQVAAPWPWALLGMAGLGLIPVGPVGGQWVTSGAAVVVLAGGIAGSSHRRALARVLAAAGAGLLAVAGVRLVPGYLLGGLGGRVTLDGVGRTYTPLPFGDLLRFQGEIEGGIHLASPVLGLVIVAAVGALLVRVPRSRPLLIPVAALTLIAWSAGRPWTLWPALHLAPGMTGVNYPLRLQWVLLCFGPLAGAWLAWWALTPLGPRAERVAAALSLVATCALLAFAPLEDRAPPSRAAAVPEAVVRGVLPSSAPPRHLGSAARDGLIREGMATALGFGPPRGAPALEGLSVVGSTIVARGTPGQTRVAPQRHLPGWTCRGATLGTPDPEAFLAVTLTADEATCGYRSPGLLFGLVAQLCAILGLVGLGVGGARIIPPMRPLLPLTLVLLLGAPGCATFSGARPLEPGETELGVSVGGPILQFGGAAIPVPNLNLQGRHGLARPLDRPLDIAYGLNLTALPFGILQGHVGVNWLLIHQRKAAPALAVTYNQFFATNAPGLPSKPKGEPAGWAANQIELNVSWLIKEQLIYAGLAQYFDFGNPRLTLTPSIGVVLDTSPKKPGGLKVHFDLRWYAVTQRDLYDAIRWVPRPQGAFGFGGGISYVIPAGGKGRTPAGSPSPVDPPEGA
jgi:hypothetical protein